MRRKRFSVEQIVGILNQAGVGVPVPDLIRQAGISEQAADGELPTRHAAQVRAHLAACWDCRARMEEVEGAITDFARAYRQSFDPNPPSIDGPRALLRARLAERASTFPASSCRSDWIKNPGAAHFYSATLFPHSLLVSAPAIQGGDFGDFNLT